jgi:hypothetical protein
MPEKQLPEKAVYLFVFPGFADCEAAHAVAELRRQEGYQAEVVGVNLNPVESTGGIMVQQCPVQHGYGRVNVR